MYCMKCGRETKDNQIFCEICLADMATRPVKPGTPIQLPSRPAPAAPRKAAARRKAPSAAEQAVKYRRITQWLALGMVVMIVALFLTISALVHTLYAGDIPSPIGQNYSTMAQTDGK